MPDRRRATLAGLGAIGLWALLAPWGSPPAPFRRSCSPP